MTELHSTHSLLAAADLEAVRHASVVTGRYIDFRPELGVGVRITRGGPEKYRWWNQSTGLVMGPKWWQPSYSEFREEDDAVGEASYYARMDSDPATQLGRLAQLVTNHAGRRLVLLCYENVHRGECCHRRWLAEWFWSRWQIEIPELPPARQDPYGGC